MRRLRLLTAVLVAFALQTGVASALQDDGLIEHMSGPGPFLRWPSLQVRVVCFTRVGNDNYNVPLAPCEHGSTAEFADRPYRATATGPAQTAKQQCSRDDIVRGYSTVA